MSALTAAGRTAAGDQPALAQADIKDARFGRNVRIIRPVNLYGCDIGDD